MPVEWGKKDKPVVWGQQDVSPQELEDIQLLMEGKPSDTFHRKMRPELPEFVQSLITTAGERQRASGSPSYGLPSTTVKRDMTGKNVVVSREEPDLSMWSPEQMTEAIPPVMGALGALIFGGHPGGAALGAAGGEALRQSIREEAGAPAAPGILQELGDMDPDSNAAKVSGVLGEAGAALTGEAIMNKLLGITPSIRKSAREGYADILSSRAKRRQEDVERIAEALEPIEDQLPVGTRRRIQRAATERVKPDTKLSRDFESIIRTGDPSSFEMAIQELEAEAKKQVRTNGTIRNPKYYKALNDRIKVLRQEEAKATQAMVDTPTGYPDPELGGITREEVFLSRGQAAEDANIESIVKGRKAKGRAKAAEAERKALRNVLHSEEYGAGKEGADVDAVWSAWKTVEEGAKGEDPGMFPVRYLFGRLIPGIFGTTSAFMATKPAFWKSMSFATKRALVKAIENGADVEAEHILRGYIRGYLAEHPEEEDPNFNIMKAGMR